MNQKRLAEAVDLAGLVGHVFIATSDLSGKPHLGAARRLSLGAENRVVGLCPETLNNLKGNPYISLVVWDVAADQGFQILGKLQEMNDLEMLNG